MAVTVRVEVERECLRQPFSVIAAVLEADRVVLPHHDPGLDLPPEQVAVHRLRQHVVHPTTRPPGAGLCSPHGSKRLVRGMVTSCGGRHRQLTAVAYRSHRWCGSVIAILRSVLKPAAGRGLPEVEPRWLLRLIPR